MFEISFGTYFLFVMVIESYRTLGPRCDEIARIPPSIIFGQHHSLEILPEASATKVILIIALFTSHFIFFLSVRIDLNYYFDQMIVPLQPVERLSIYNITTSTLMSLHGLCSSNFIIVSHYRCLIRSLFELRCPSKSQIPIL